MLPDEGPFGKNGLYRSSLTFMGLWARCGRRHMEAVLSACQGSLERPLKVMLTAPGAVNE